LFAWLVALFVYVLCLLGWVVLSFGDYNSVVLSNK